MPSQLTKRDPGYDTVSMKSQPLNMDKSAADPQLSARSAGWSACASLMKQYDTERVKMWKDDIDTLLVFAGLLSAVVSTFSAQSYTMLQINSSTSPSTFQPPSSAVRLNILWFSSLVCSLVTALTGILAKQWLREYTTEGSSSSREAVRLRQHRYNNLIRWQVPGIIASLPLLLEASLILFLLGLIELLWSLHRVVAEVVTALIVTSLLLYVATSILPAILATCPYKSPRSWGIFLMWELLYEAVMEMGQGKTASSFPEGWRERDMKSLQGRRGLLDRDAFAWCHSSSSDQDMLDSITPALEDLKPAMAVSFVFQKVAEAAGCSVTTLISSIRDSGSEPLSDVLALVIGPRGTARTIRMLLCILPKIPHDTVSTIVNVLDAICILRQLLMRSASSFCDSELHRQALSDLIELVNYWEPIPVQRASLHLLWDMTSSGCNLHFCPDGIGNILTCAKDALSRSDLEMFCMSCAVALGRLPALKLTAREFEGFRRIWLEDWMEDIEVYFRDRNARELPYDIGFTTRWCTGLLAMTKQLDEKLPLGSLLKTMDEGVSLKICCRDSEEQDAWEELKDMYRHIFTTEL
ncbi:uncharacterized protein FIBRA_01311 [Fibroporia radiculosa]|uniref:DUF6535 domain-containing protein n=1 Tax=Fibroporia radiculosa TaxID=599839 RepID=J4GJU2_9APHY|nr:uncharacterized protein FIBRA_01311 [Fibroporia radiculosa]CCL99295.1 predicted protein [Fibroporia radiculosa]